MTQFSIKIKGHKTRGKEVIEILQMLGGRNTARLKGTDVDVMYYICSTGDIATLYTVSNKHYKVWTLEEFLEEFPYKVGDKVQHKGATSCGTVYVIERMTWVHNHTEYDIRPLYDNNHTGLVTLCVESLQPYKEEAMDRKYNVEEYIEVWGETEKGLEVVVNDRFELTEDNGKFYIIKKQPQYPKTYKECCAIVNASPYVNLVYNLADEQKYSYDVDNLHVYENLRRLLICRDAYWKIAGEQMGLGKPWQPDWTKDTKKYVIYHYLYLYSIDVEHYRNTLLAFPTAEMRDAFYKNFKDLIEACKELL